MQDQESVWRTECAVSKSEETEKEAVVHVLPYQIIICLQGMFMESSLCHEVIRRWLGSLKALMSNRRKREVMKYNLVYMISVQKTTPAGKPEEDWETLRNPFLHKALVQSLCSDWLCVFTACVRASWPCIRHGHPLSQVSWGHKATWLLDN